MKDKVKDRSQSGDGSDLYLLSQTLKVRWGLGLLPIGKEVRFLPHSILLSLECQARTRGRPMGKGPGQSLQVIAPC